MKYLVVIADGMADYPIKAIGGKTPLEYIETPFIDRLAKTSLCGVVKTVPEGMSPGSDVANLSIFGYDPKRFFSGRAPLEAASMGIEMGLEDVAFRCNLVSLRDHNTVMDDYSAGHITTAEAAEYIAYLNEKMTIHGISFFTGVSYRHILIWQSGRWKLKLTPPHDIPDKNIQQFLPTGEGAEFIWGIMKRSMDLLKGCLLNEQRKNKGKKEVSSIWLWGQGKKPSMPTFIEKYGLKGNVIAAVDLIMGIGVLAGLQPIKVKGATGYIDTNFEGKAEAALRSLRDHDICFVHIEACDESSHEGSFDKKTQAIRAIDQRFFKTLLEGLDDFENYRLLLVVDHPTPVELKIHVSDPVPFLIYEKNSQKKGVFRFTENECQKAGFFIEDGYTLMDVFLNGETR